jgi:hypothetical protein
MTGSSLIKSNGLFLVEPSAMSQVAALGIMIEVIEFRRPRYMLLLTLGLLLAYSGSGIVMLLLGLPLSALVNRRAQLPTLLVSVLAFGLLVTGIVDLPSFTDRIGEFEDTRASGFVRFVSPFWMAEEHFGVASLPEWLRGKGPSSEDAFIPGTVYIASSATWFRLIYEYGLIGTLIFACFLGSCFRRSRCPKPLMASLMFLYVFNSNNLHCTWLVIIMVVLCTLSGPEPRRRRIDEINQAPSSLVAEPAVGLS